MECPRYVIALSEPSCRIHSIILCDISEYDLSFLLSITSSKQTLAITSAPSKLILSIILLTIQSPMLQLSASFTIYSQRGRSIWNCQIHQLTIRNSRFQFTHSWMASRTTSLQFMPTKVLILSNRSNSRGSRKLKPNVILGLVKSLAYQTVASATIDYIYFRNTRSAILLHISFSSTFSCPSTSSTDSRSYFKQVIFDKMISLDYLYTTLDQIELQIDFASRYCSRRGGYIFRRVRKPRTRACIFRSRGSVSFIIIFLVGPSLSLSLAAKGDLEPASRLVMQVGGILLSNDLWAALASRDLLLFSSMLIYSM